MYKFYITHPKTTTCPKPTQCGFLVKVTPITKENTEQFNMQLITDPTMYPADLHFHSDLLSADKMHITVERNKMYTNKWYSCNISWWGKPEYMNSGEFWGGCCGSWEVTSQTCWLLRPEL